MEEELKPRYLRLIQGVAEGKTKRQAAIDAGFPEKSAGNQATRVLSRPEVRARFQELRARMGLDDESLLLKAAELLESQQFALSKDGEVKCLGPDNLAQSRTLDQLFKAGGLYPDTRIDIEVGTQNVLVIDSARSPLAALDPFQPVAEQPDDD